MKAERTCEARYNVGAAHMSGAGDALVAHPGSVSGPNPDQRRAAVPDHTSAPTVKARPTVYNGVQMRSRLEAGYAMWLDSVGARWDYEPECFATEEGQYLPDFVIRDMWVLWDDRVTDLYVEVKPKWRPEFDAKCERWSRIIKATYPESLFTVAWPGANTSRYPVVLTPRGLAIARSAPEPWQGDWWEGVDVDGA